MDLSVEITEGSGLPAGSHVAVRMGDVVKQGRYEPSRIYHFPGANQRRIAKVDIFRLVGSAVLPVDPDGMQGPSKVHVRSEDPSVDNFDVKVNVRRNEQQVKASEKARVRSQVKRGFRQQGIAYIVRTGIELKLAEALQQMLHECPDDPINFLCDFLRGIPNPAKMASMETVSSSGSLQRPWTVPSEPASETQTVSEAMESTARSVIWKHHHTPQGSDSGLLAGCSFNIYYQQHFSPQCPRPLWSNLHSAFRSARESGDSMPARCIATAQQASLLGDRQHIHEYDFNRYYQQHFYPRCSSSFWSDLYRTFQAVEKPCHVAHSGQIMPAPDSSLLPFRSYYLQHFLDERSMAEWYSELYGAFPGPRSHPSESFAAAHQTDLMRNRHHIHESAFAGYHQQHFSPRCSSAFWSNLYTAFQAVEKASHSVHSRHIAPTQDAELLPFRSYYLQHVLTQRSMSVWYGELHNAFLGPCRFACNQETLHGATLEHEERSVGTRRGCTFSPSVGTWAKRRRFPPRLDQCVTAWTRTPHETTTATIGSGWRFAPSVGTWTTRRLRGDFPPRLDRRVEPGTAMSDYSASNGGSVIVSRRMSSRGLPVGICGESDFAAVQELDLSAVESENLYGSGDVAESAESVGGLAEIESQMAESELCLAETCELSKPLPF